MHFQRFCFLLVLLGLGLCGSALAGFSNYNSILIGDQAAGMGGAATALVGDVSGAAFYNPATIAESPGGSFSAAVGIYKKFDTVYGKDEDFTKAPLRVNQGFFRSLPSSTGNTIRRGDYLYGLSIVVPDYDEFKGDISKVGDSVTTLTFRDESLWVGATMARKTNENESFGLTSYYTSRSFTRTLNDRYYPTSTHVQVFAEEKTKTENALLFVVGYWRKLTENLNLGVSLRTPALRISGTGSLFRSTTDVDTSTSSFSTPTENYTAQSVRVVIPSKLALGLTYLYDGHLLFSGDFTLHEGPSYVDFTDPSIGTQINHKIIWNGALGIQESFKDWLKVRLGCFTNFSSQRDPSIDFLNMQEDKVDMLGFSANVVFISDQKINYTFGGYYSGGRGKSLQKIQQQYQVITKNQHVFTMLVGTSFSF